MKQKKGEKYGYKVCMEVYWGKIGVKYFFLLGKESFNLRYYSGVKHVSV